MFICGTDEYGTATEIKALEEKCTPREICDKYYDIHKEIYHWFQLEFDFFGRTSTEKQTEYIMKIFIFERKFFIFRISQDIFWKLYNQGYIFKDKVKQWYCSQCSL